jgi:2-dehydropantoate 2-reductase
MNGSPKMKIAILGAGAMGSVVGGALAKAGNDVSFIEVAQPVIDAINSRGLVVEDKAGARETIPTRATSNPSTVGPVDLLVVFVKCYHTEAAVRNALPLIGPATIVLSLQNGWGNGPRIAGIVGQEKLLLGVSYHSATVSAPGHVLHVGKGMTFIGEPNGAVTERLERTAAVFQNAGLEVTTRSQVIKEIWSKLALNACTLPTSSLLRFYAPQLVQHDSMLLLMRELLEEVVAVARAQNIALELDERWEAITGLLKRCAPTAKSSMLQDVEQSRATEIDVINGAIVEAGRGLNIATPYNNAMLWMVKSLEETFKRPAA